jgi:anti-anti-sigma factor
MGVPTAISHPVGRTRGDHLCWGYRDYDRFRHTAAAFLEEGRRAGEQLLFVGEGSVSSLLDDLALWSARDEVLATGQLTVQPLAEVYDSMADLDVEGQVAAFRALSRNALAAGYSGLRVAADVTGLTRSAGDWERFAAYELAVDEMMSTHPATGMCGWREASAARPGALSALHRYQHRELGPVVFAVRRRDSVLHLSGEVDASVADDLAAVLQAVELHGTRTVQLDLSELDFIDVAGTRALAQFCDTAPGGVRILGALDGVSRCLDLFGLPVDGRIAECGP